MQLGSAHEKWRRRPPSEARRRRPGDQLRATSHAGARARAAQVRVRPPRPRIADEAASSSRPGQDESTLPRPAAGRPGARPGGWRGVPRPVRARAQRHLLPDGDPAQPGHRRRASATTPVVWDASCLEEVCGSCTMIVNGRVRQACSALVDQLEQPITLEPMTQVPGGARPARRPRADVRGAQAGEGLDRPSTAPTTSGPGPRIVARASRSSATRSRRCMTCGCCLEACPQVNERQRLHRRGGRSARRGSSTCTRPGAMNADERLRGADGRRAASTTAARRRTASRSARRRSRSPRDRRDRPPETVSGEGPVRKDAEPSRPSARPSRSMAGVQGASRTVEHAPEP